MGNLVLTKSDTKLKFFVRWFTVLHFTWFHKGYIPICKGNIHICISFMMVYYFEQKKFNTNDNIINYKILNITKQDCSKKLHNYIIQFSLFNLFLNDLLKNLS